MSRPDETLIHLRGVHRVFPGSRVALDSVDLDVAGGEFVSLLGPSGCGKSTVLRLVSGLDAPSRGHIERDPALMAQPPGYVFQDAALMPWASVRRNVALPLVLRREPRDQVDEKVDTALREVGLSDSAEAMPRELSGGMKMRVSLARALVTRPRLWLLDEPFGALDEITRFALNQALLALCRPGEAEAATALFVTHSIYEAVFLSQRVVVMARPGRVVDEIAVQEPYPRRPAFRTSARYTECCARVAEALEGAGIAPGTSSAGNPGRAPGATGAGQA